MQGQPCSSSLAVLSMHQPWASLLVYGLKRIEGRGWPTDHRGKLWIHATSQQATAQEIEVHSAMLRPYIVCLNAFQQISQQLHNTLQEMQSFYRQIHQQEGTDILPNLPKNYPTSVLIGCVDVVACYSVSLS